MYISVVRRPFLLVQYGVFSLALVSSFPACAAVPNVAGAVTAATSPTDFEVNGIQIVCDARTRFSALRPADVGLISWSEKPYIGEPLLIYGRTHHHAIHASRVVFAPPEGRLRGSAIIDRMLATQPAGSLLVRADGYPILLSPSARIVFIEPLKTLADINSNTWIEYQGNQRSDGVVVAAKAVLYLNTIDDREVKLRARTGYDPSTSPANKQQDKDLEHRFQHVFAGRDPKQIPPSPDTAMQARVDAIGEKVVPAYQRALSDRDPSKISFRFQLVEQKYAANRIDLPNGTILIPRDAVARLQNDDQLAAYIAAGVAAILEKQQLRDTVEKRLLTAGEIGGIGWIAPTFWAADRKQDLERSESEQRIRVSFALLHDAGYNLAEVPKAWCLLTAKKPRSRDEEMPDEAIYAYVFFGSTWRNLAWQ